VAAGKFLPIGKITADVVYFEMKNLLKKMLGLALFGLLGSVGFCVEEPPAEPDSRYTFVKGDFHITLVIGPQWRASADGALPHSTSYYRISRKLPNGEGKVEWKQVRLGSALYTFHADRKPDYLKFHVSESGDTLLIEEPVPNDCNEVINYLLIKTETSTYFGSTLDARYLEAKDAKGKAFTFEQRMEWGVAKVRSITDGGVTFFLGEYGDQDKDWTMELDDVVKEEQKPQFPG
jgi:hypothetical protein